MVRLTRRDFVTVAAAAILLNAEETKGETMEIDSEKLKAEALATLEAYNRAWAVEGAPERLTEFFHPEMVAITPSERERIESGAACVEGWSAFTRAVRITRWSPHGAKVQLWGGGEVAVISYYYDMSWETPEGQVVEAAGRDMFVLARQEGRWWAVADQFSPYPGGK
ncbi:nuclear transport factor 2 family protein [bacterium]|nr:nuclear transport factor 2 family protein [bacterium]